MIYAALYLPQFSLQAAFRMPLAKSPLALLDAEAIKPVLLQVNAPAYEVGVRPGMTATQAMARCARIKIRKRSLALEEAVSNNLLHAAYRSSPDIEATAPGLITMDWSRLRDLQPESQATRLLQQLARLELQGQVGVAPTPQLAGYAARAAKPILVVGSRTEFLETLPIEMATPSPRIQRLLHKWGIATVGQLLALDHNELVLRLGPEGLEFLERAAANQERPLHCVLPPAHFAEAIEFEHEVESLAPLIVALRGCLERLAAQMVEADLVAEALTLCLTLVGSEPYERTLTLPAPTRDVSLLLRVIQTHLEGVRSDQPLKAIRVAIQPGKAWAHQFGLFETVVKDPQQFGESLARLGAVVGADRVGTPQPLPSHRPDAFLLRAVNLESNTSETNEIIAERKLGLPLRRFRPPLPAQVRATDGQPSQVATRNFRAVLRDARGPWKISGEWWTPQHWRRSEWDVQAEDGSLYRIFEEEGAWFVDGIYG